MATGTKLVIFWFQPGIGAGECWRPAGKIPQCMCRSAAFEPDDPFVGPITHLATVVKNRHGAVVANGVGVVSLDNAEYPLYPV